jgi:hypothetical protein
MAVKVEDHRSSTATSRSHSEGNYGAGTVGGVGFAGNLGAAPKIPHVGLVKGNAAVPISKGYKLHGSAGTLIIPQEVPIKEWGLPSRSVTS